jgi:hypothetical protein
MLIYTSVLKAQYHDALEQLMFFNPGQHNARGAILGSLEAFGSPSVYVDGDQLRVKVEKLDEVQILFALNDDVLAGVMMYSRISPERLTVIHIAVDGDHSSEGKFADVMLVMRMLNLLRNSARRIKGVQTIRLLHNNNQVKDYPI